MPQDGYKLGRFFLRDVDSHDTSHIEVESARAIAESSAVSVLVADDVGFYCSLDSGKPLGITIIRVSFIASRHRPVELWPLAENVSANTTVP